jgi:hypothetical protein
MFFPMKRPLSPNGLGLCMVAALALFRHGALGATDIASLTYGGYAFAGDAGDIARDYPYTSAVDRSDGKGTSLISSSVNAFMRAHPDSIPNVSLSFGLIQKDQSALILALALTDEKVLKEDIGDMHKLVVDLGLELLTLDFGDMQVVSSVPITLELIDAQPAPFSESDVVGRVRAMLIGDDAQLSKVLVEKLRLVTVRSRNACTLQVSAVTVGEKALPFLPESLKAAPSTYGRFVAQQFGSLLSARAGVVLLPFSKDGLNSRMALRFSDASVLQFSIPEPTYAIDLNVKGFKKILSQRTESESLWIYGAYLGVRVFEPEFQRVYFEGTAKYPVSKIVPASQPTVDEFPVVSEALKGAFLNAIDLLRNDPSTRDAVLNKCKP